MRSSSARTRRRSGLARRFKWEHILGPFGGQHRGVAKRGFRTEKDSSGSPAATGRFFLVYFFGIVGFIFSRMFRRTVGSVVVIASGKWFVQRDQYED